MLQERGINWLRGAKKPPELIILSQDIESDWNLIKREITKKGDIAYIWHHQQELKQINEKTKRAWSIAKPLCNEIDLTDEQKQKFNLACERAIAKTQKIKPNNIWFKLLNSDIENILITLDKITKESDQYHFSTARRMQLAKLGLHPIRDKQLIGILSKNHEWSIFLRILRKKPTKVYAQELLSIFKELDKKYLNHLDRILLLNLWGLDINNHLDIAFLLIQEKTWTLLLTIVKKHKEKWELDIAFNRISNILTTQIIEYKEPILQHGTYDFLRIINNIFPECLSNYNAMKNWNETNSFKFLGFKGIANLTGICYKGLTKRYLELLCKIDIRLFNDGWEPVIEIFKIATDTNFEDLLKSVIPFEHLLLEKRFTEVLKIVHDFGVRETIKCLSELNLYYPRYQKTKEITDKFGLWYIIAISTRSDMDYSLQNIFVRCFAVCHPIIMKYGFDTIIEIIDLTPEKNSSNVLENYLAPHYETFQKFGLKEYKQIISLNPKEERDYNLFDSLRNTGKLFREFGFTWLLDIINNISKDEFFWFFRSYLSKISPFINENNLNFYTRIIPKLINSCGRLSYNLFTWVFPVIAEFFSAEIEQEITKELPLMIKLLKTEAGVFNRESNKEATKNIISFSSLIAFIKLMIFALKSKNSRTEFNNALIAFEKLPNKEVLPIISYLIKEHPEKTVSFLRKYDMFIHLDLNLRREIELLTNLVKPLASKEIDPQITKEQHSTLSDTSFPQESREKLLRILNSCLDEFQGVNANFLLALQAEEGFEEFRYLFSREQKINPIIKQSSFANLIYIYLAHELDPEVKADKILKTIKKMQKREKKIINLLKKPLKRMNSLQIQDILQKIDNLIYPSIVRFIDHIFLKKSSELAEMFNVDPQEVKPLVNSDSFLNASQLLKRLKNNKDDNYEFCYALIQNYLKKNTYPFQKVPNSYPYNTKENKQWSRDNLTNIFWLSPRRRVYLTNQIRKKNIKSDTFKFEQYKLKVIIESEYNPLETLQMGNYITGSCLATNNINYWSTVPNACDANKLVLWARNMNNEVIGRVLIAVDSDKKIVRFRIYQNGEANLTNCFDQFIIELAKDCRFGLNGCITKVKHIMCEEWYHDPPISTINLYELAQKQKSLVQELKLHIDFINFNNESKQSSKYFSLKLAQKIIKIPNFPFKLKYLQCENQTFLCICNNKNKTKIIINTIPNKRDLPDQIYFTFEDRQNIIFNNTSFSQIYSKELTSEEDLIKAQAESVSKARSNTEYYK